MKVAAKILRTSDLTLFRSHYNQHKGPKQKAINLNRDVFIDKFFPGLAEHVGRIPVAMDLRGPKGLPTATHAQNATILKQAKNWRLDGRLIEDPPDEPGRFADLSEGDIAVMGFEGGERPTHVVLMLASLTGDPELHRALQNEIGFGSGRDSMRVLSPQELERLVSETGGSGLQAFLVPDTLEAAMYESPIFGDGRGVSLSPEAVRLQANNAAEIGCLGEEAFEEWLIQLGLSDEDYEWVSKTHARAAFDFYIRRPLWNTEICDVHVDVKTTRGAHDAAIHMSHPEVAFAARTPEYRIARVSELSSTSACITLLTGVPDFCTKLLACTKGLDSLNVVADSYSILPSRLIIEHRSEVSWSEGA